MTVNNGINNFSSLAIGSDYLELAVRSNQPGTSSLQWVSNQDSKTAAYQIERAGADGEFKIIETIVVVDPSEYAIVREFIDNDPLPGINRYRVTQLRSDDTEFLSNQEELAFEVYTSIFPNPTKDGVYFEMKENLQTDILLDIYTIDGKHLRQELLENTAGLKYIDLSTYELSLIHI